MNNETLVTTHTLTVFNAVDIPDAIASKVMALLDSYDPDIYTRPCDSHGHTNNAQF